MFMFMKETFTNETMFRCFSASSCQKQHSSQGEKVYHPKELSCKGNFCFSPKPLVKFVILSHNVCLTGQAVQAVKVLSTLSQMVWGTFLFVSKRVNYCLREARIVCALFSSILQSQNADGGNRVRKSAPRCLLDRGALGVKCYLDNAHLNRPLFKKGASQTKLFFSGLRWRLRGSSMWQR